MVDNERLMGMLNMGMLPTDTEDAQRPLDRLVMWAMELGFAIGYADTEQDLLNELASQVKALQHENDCMMQELDLMTRKIITCAVAADHPDPTLSLRQRDYGGSWNSPQADRVRALRVDRDQIMELARDALKAWDGDHEIRVGKLLRAITDAEFRKTYRPDLYT